MLQCHASRLTAAAWLALVVGCEGGGAGSGIADQPIEDGETQRALKIDRDIPASENGGNELFGCPADYVIQTCEDPTRDTTPRTVEEIGLHFPPSGVGVAQLSSQYINSWAGDADQRSALKVYELQNCSSAEQRVVNVGACRQDPVAGGEYCMLQIASAPNPDGGFDDVRYEAIRCGSEGPLTPAREQARAALAAYTGPDLFGCPADYVGSVCSNPSVNTRQWQTGGERGAEFELHLCTTASNMVVNTASCREVGAGGLCTFRVGSPEDLFNGGTMARTEALTCPDATVFPAAAVPSGTSLTGEGAAQPTGAPSLTDPNLGGKTLGGQPSNSGN